MLSTKRLELIKHRDSAMVFLGYSHIATIMLGDFYTQQKRLSLDSLFLTGNFLSSQAVSSQVLSAFMCLTTVFGMGTGGTT